MSQKLYTKKEECRYGFSCALIMQQPGLTAIDCPNRSTCGTITRFEYDLEFDFETSNGTQRFTPAIAAHTMLLQRGNSQTPESLGINSEISRIHSQLESLSEAIEAVPNKFIAPENCEVHQYNVKRPFGVYWYNKLASPEAMFVPQVKENPVKVIHLSKYDDYRNIEGRKGIERRNQLLKIKNKLSKATAILQEIENDITPLYPGHEPI